MPTHTHPENALERYDKQRDLEERTNLLIHRVRSDQLDMQEWLRLKLVAAERRYSRHERDVHVPWANASDIWMPLTDLYVGQIKPIFMNLLFGGSKVARMHPVNAQGFENAPAAEMMMEHILRGGSVNSMPDFELQMAMAVDSMCVYGLGLLHTYYSFRSRNTVETLRRDDLPGILAQLIIKPNMTEGERREAQARFPQMNPMELVGFFGEPVNPMNKEVFDRHKVRIEDEVKRLYGLDEEDRADKTALAEIMAYLRSGTKERSIAVTKRETLEHTPRIVNVPIQDLIVPPNALWDFSRAERVTHRLYYTETDIKEMAEDNDWNDEATNRVLETAATQHGLGMHAGLDELTWFGQTRMAAEGLGREEQFFELWKIYHFEDIAKKGLPELVVTTLEPNSGAVLKKTPYPYDHGQIPFSVLPFEVNEAAYRAPRGVSEILTDIEAHVSAWHRTLENNMEISSSVTMAVSRNTFDNPNDIDIFPGLVIPTDNPTQDIVPVPWPQFDIPIERLTQLYMLWPERLIGGIDNLNLLEGSAPDRRTATEVSSIESARQRLMGMRGTLFLKAMQRPLQQAWALWKQYGPREAYIHITGEAPMMVTQHMTRGRFNVQPMAAVGPMDPQFRRAQLTMRLQEAIQLAPLMANDPRWELDLAQAFADKLQEEDPLAARRLLRARPPEQQQQMIQESQARAQRLAEIRDIAERALENAPIGTEEAMKLHDAMVKSMPHKELQNIIASANDAEQRHNAAQTLLAPM